ncbi:MAG: sensor histidine kinase [Saprospiraceae bacterium]
MNLRTMTGNRTMTIGLHLAFWVVLGTVNYLVIDWFVPARLILLRTLVNLSFMALLFYVNAFVLVNQVLEKKRYLLFGALALVLVLVFVPIRVRVNMLFPPIPTNDLTGAHPERGFALAGLLTNLAIVLFSTLYQVLINRYAIERKSWVIINRQNEAQLQFLKAQINPHFLFNTLNNIYSLAVVRSEKTADMVLKLSQLLRYVVYDGKGEMVFVEQEIAHIRQFIELFEMRSETPLHIDFHCEGDFSGYQMEPMILIPIVENCFKHCDFDTNDNANVMIEMTMTGKRLTFRTVNTKNDADQQKDGTGGVGIDNIVKRLDLKYPKGYLLSTTDYGSTFEVFFSMKLPQKKLKHGSYQNATR